MLTATNNAADDGWSAAEDVDEPHRPGTRIRAKTAKKPRKTKAKSPLWAKIIIVLGVLILLASIGGYVAVKLVLNQVNNAVPQKSMLGDAGVGPATGGKAALDGALNVLMIGNDERTGLAGSRADTIIVLHVNAKHDAAYLLSVPRDTLVDIPAFPKTKFKGSHEKINASYDYGSQNGGGREGGFELLAKTVSQVTGISFNAGAIVNFDGFQAVVNALGGVDMCIDETTTSFDHNTNGEELGRYGGTAMVYKKGCQHLKPWQALDFVRQRHSLATGDYGRQRHQQQFIKAVAKAAMSQGLTDPVKLNQVMTAAGKALTVDPGTASLTDWIFVLKGLGIANMTMLKTNGGAFAPMTCPNGESCEVLTPDSLAMFTAAKNDALPAFISKHPTWVAPDK
jgi:polyisoprenyl-teichoic acid--peptidoglycan teichoic acid transferase